MVLEHISVTQWLSLPQEVRNELVKIFSIEKSAYTVVEDQVVVSDGYCTEDLFAITIEKCQEYLGVKNEGDRLIDLFNAVVAKIQKGLVNLDEEAKIEETEIEGEGEIKEDVAIESTITNVKRKRSNVRTKKEQN